MTVEELNQFLVGKPLDAEVMWQAPDSDLIFAASVGYHTDQLIFDNHIPMDGKNVLVISAKLPSAIPVLTKMHEDSNAT